MAQNGLLGEEIMPEDCISFSATRSGLQILDDHKGEDLKFQQSHTPQSHDWTLGTEKLGHIYSHDSPATSVPPVWKELPGRVRQDNYMKSQVTNKKKFQLQLIEE